MNLCLGMLFCERDLPWVKLHLPVYVKAFGSNPIIIGYDMGDYGQESHDYFTKLDADVQMIEINFHQDWSAALNQIIDFGIWLKQDAMLRLDPDELMFGGDIELVGKILNHYSLIGLARYNFWYDRTQVNVNAYGLADAQWRAWRLDGRARYVGKRHEGVAFGGHARETLICPDVAIYHYGDIGKQNIWARALRYINYDRADLGLEPLTEIPPDRPPGAKTEPFDKPQPLDPAVCGLTAPFEE